jgi:hypothetical protein
MSETNTPVFTSTSATATGNESVTLADEIKKYNTDELISFLRGQDLGLSESALKILENEDVTGRAFFKMTKQDFRDIDIKAGPALVLADFAKECKDKRLRSFSSYKTKKDLKEVLAKYGVEDGRITDIPQFAPSKFFSFIFKLLNFQNCITNIWYFADL